MLEALEKYINNSGLDQAFVEAAIYGSATTEQMKYGKHMKKSFEANTKLNVALFCVYMKRFVSVHPLTKKKLQERIANAAVVMENFTRK